MSYVNSRSHSCDLKQRCNTASLRQPSPPPALSHIFTQTLINKHKLAHTQMRQCAADLLSFPNSGGGDSVLIQAAIRGNSTPWW